MSDPTSFLIRTKVGHPDDIPNFVPCQLKYAQTIDRDIEKEVHFKDTSLAIFSPFIIFARENR